MKQIVFAHPAVYGSDPILADGHCPCCGNVHGKRLLPAGGDSWDGPIATTWRG